jgi:hypothetical protein
MCHETPLLLLLALPSLLKVEERETSVFYLEHIMHDDDIAVLAV